MTREEAIVELELAARFCVNISALSMAQNIANAIAVLREPQLDENGLVPCGCGGKANIWLSDFTRFTCLITDYEVGCTECAMTTGWVRGKQENAMKVWNTAMGWKGGAE